MSDFLRENLTSIYQQRKMLTPQIVVDESRPPDAPLHSRFEWDDAEAGEAYRRVQAAGMIRSVQITVCPHPDKPAHEVRVRAFHAKREHNEYIPAEIVRQSPELSALMLTEMEREWRQLRRKYEAHREFWTLIKSDLAA